MENLYRIGSSTKVPEGSLLCSAHLTEKRALKIWLVGQQPIRIPNGFSLLHLGLLRISSFIKLFAAVELCYAQLAENRPRNQLSQALFSWQKQHYAAEHLWMTRDANDLS